MGCPLPTYIKEWRRGGAGHGEARQGGVLLPLGVGLLLFLVGVGLLLFLVGVGEGEGKGEEEKERERRRRKEGAGPPCPKPIRFGPWGALPTLPLLPSISTKAH